MIVFGGSLLFVAGMFFIMASVGAANPTLNGLQIIVGAALAMLGAVMVLRDLDG